MKKFKFITSIPQFLVVDHTKNLFHHIKHIFIQFMVKIWSNLNKYC
jgi:ssDNA-specific exonuclease RecJ